MKFDEELVRHEIKNAHPDTIFYFGCDSRKYRKKNGEFWASYATVVIAHIGGKHGCKVFGQIEKERLYNNNMKMRLLMEAYKVCDMVLMFQDDLDDRPFEVHLDINSDPKAKSNIALKEATGYVLGMTGVTPLFKPESFASSCAADMFEGKQENVSKRKYNTYLKKGKKDQKSKRSKVA